MALEAVGIGDPHLPDQDGLGGLARYIDKPEQYVCSEIDRVCAWAVKHNIRVVIIYGDICDRPRMSYEAQIALSRTFAKYKGALEFYVILGNHDVIGRTSDVGHSLEVLDEFNAKSHVHYVVKPADIVIDDAKVRFLPFPYSKFSSKALNVCHLDVQGAVSDSGRVINNKERDASDRVIVAGHIHMNQRVRNTYYSGTLYQTCFGERPEKFFHHIQFASADDYEIQSIAFKPKVRLHTITIQNKDDIPQGFTANDLVKLVIQDGARVTPVHYQHLNVVQTRTFQSRKQLASVLTEDLPTNGQELKLSTKEFFDVWVQGADASPEVKAQASTIRKRILSSVR